MIHVWMKALPVSGFTQFPSGPPCGQSGAPRHTQPGPGGLCWLSRELFKRRSNWRFGKEEEARREFLQAPRISQVDWIAPYIRIRVDPARQPDGIAFDIAPRPWVVVAEIIVMQVGRLIEELPRKAKLVGEGAHWGAIAEGVMVPLPHDRAAGLGDPMRRAKMIRRDIKSRGPIREGAKSAAIPSGPRGRACR